MQQTLAVDSRGSVGRPSRARSILVVADLALALVLLAAAGLMLRTVVALTHTNPGFNAERILSLQFSLVGKAYAEDAAVVAFQRRALEKLRAIPGVEGVALGGPDPIRREPRLLGLPRERTDEAESGGRSRASSATESRRSTCA